MGTYEVTRPLLPPSVTLLSISLSLSFLSSLCSSLSFFIKTSCMYVQCCSCSQTSPSTCNSNSHIIYTEIDRCGVSLSLTYIEFPLPLSFSPAPRHGSTSSTSSSDSSSSSDSESSGEEGEVLPSPPKGKDTTLQNPFVMDFDVSIQHLHTVH